MKNHKTDLCIVGAGPGGVTAAYFAARQGLSVALIDKKTFPRDKICGDSFACESARTLEEMGLLEKLEQAGSRRTVKLLLSSPDRSHALIERRFGEDPRMFTMPRRIVDAAMLDKAKEAGVRVFEDTLIRSIERKNADAVQVRGRRGKEQVLYESPLVIIAEGAHATLAKKLGITRGYPDAFALRAYYEGAEGDRDTQEIHWESSISPGYAWVFPVGGGLTNVGIGVFTYHFKKVNMDLKKLLEVFIRNNPHARKRLARAKQVSLAGYPLRMNSHKTSPFADNVLVVGEAAGVTSPLTGEGIGQAMKSGKIAAKAARNALSAGDFSRRQLRQYGHSIAGEFWLDHWCNWILNKINAQPFILNRTVRTAARDREFGDKLFRVIQSMDRPASFFHPKWASRLIFENTGPFDKFLRKEEMS